MYKVLLCIQRTSDAISLPSKAISGTEGSAVICNDSEVVISAGVSREG